MFTLNCKGKLLTVDKPLVMGIINVTPDSFYEYSRSMKDDEVYLRHILDAIARIESYVVVGRSVFMSTSHWQDAVIRQLEIVGEATKNLSRDLRSRYPNVPWRRIAGESLDA